MKYPHILARLRSSRWAIRPASLQAIYDTLGAHLRGSLPAHLPGMPGIVDAREDRALTPEVAASLRAAGPDYYHPSQSPQPGAPSAAQPQPSPIAVVPVYGIIGKHLSSLETMCGGCDVDAVEADIKEALADGNVKAILLDFDSPGGVVTGVPELATKIRAWQEGPSGKPIYGYTENLCASAAYWLASACAAIFTTRTADIGSIGVYIALVDDSEWWRKEGFKLELIKAGEFKAMGISGKPLSETERALLQGDVDTIYAMFTADVRQGRGALADEVMQGQTFLGEAAVTAQLADEVVQDIATVVAVLAEEELAK